jgi:hypothetical protein
MNLLSIPIVSAIGAVVAVLVAAACAGSTTPAGTPAAPANTATVAASPVVTPSASPEAPKSGKPAAGAELRQHERSFLPGLSAVETWREVATAGKPENFAPSVVRLPDGRYRMYVNDGPGHGVASFISSDGLSFTKEVGERLGQGGAGALDCIASHPWVVQMDGGYRMYYQGDANCVQGDQGQQHAFRIFSAFSPDGLTFKREGVRVDVGGTTGLVTAAHGRILRLSDGSYRMYFSANLAGKDGPADVIGASSRDGLTWTVDARPILERAHDPTVIAVDGKVYLYTTYLGDNFVLLESSDGYQFTAVAWIDFYNRAGTRIEEFGDVDITHLPDGRLAIYGSGKGSKGVSILVRE